MQEAVDHIHKYGSSHTDVIVTENGKAEHTPALWWWIIMYHKSRHFTELILKLQAVLMLKIHASALNDVL